MLSACFVGQALIEAEAVTVTVDVVEVFELDASATTFPVMLVAVGDESGMVKFAIKQSVSFLLQVKVW